MKKNLLLALKHMQDNLGSVLIMMTELIVVLFLSAYFVSSIVETGKREQLYQQLQFDKIAEVYEEDLSALSDSVKIINDQKRSGISNLLYQGKTIWVDYVSAQYFSYLQYPMRKGTAPDPDNTSVVQGVFTDAMKDRFQVGKVYPLEDAQGESFDVLMVGQLKGNYIYRENGHVIGPVANHIFLYDGGDLLSYPIYNHTITVFVEDETSLTEVQKELLIWSRDGESEMLAKERRQRGTPMIIGIMVLVLGFATFAGYNFMQMLQKEKIYGVYYLCGASWKDCLQIQVLVDFITVGIPLSVTTVFLSFVDYSNPASGSEYMLTWEGFGIMASICLLTFLVTSLEGILRLQKKSPVAIIERWNQT